MLDTNICIYIIKHQPSTVLGRLVALPTEEVGISVITAAELRYGASKSARPERNHEALDGPDVVAEGYNPLCGDEIEVQLKFAGDAIDEISFRGHGCSISQASGSMLTIAVKGKSADEVRSLIESFKRMMTDPDSEPPEGAVGRDELREQSPFLASHGTLAVHQNKRAVGSEGFPRQ